MSDTQSPAAADYRRAAALYLHRAQNSLPGINAVLAEADALGRLSALVLAITNVAFMAPAPIASAEGLAGLQRIALDMAQSEG